MHFPISSFLLLTTAALTSIVTATRPFSATPFATPEGEVPVDIAQRDVNHKSANDLLASAINKGIWADPNKVQHDNVPLYVAHHDAIEINAKASNNLAHRAVLSATITEHDVQTMTTDVAAAAATWMAKEKPIDNQGKSKVNAGPSQQVYSAAVENHFGGPKAGYGSALNPKSTGPAAPTKSLPTSLAQAFGSSHSVSFPPPPPPNASAPAPSQPTTPLPISSNANTKPVKRVPDTFEYIYDTTTKLVIGTHYSGYTGSYVVTRPTASLKHLHFGQVSLVPTAKKSG